MFLQGIDRVWVNPGPDKGWSWVVLFACCIGSILTFGVSTTGCAGVLFTELIAVYGVTREQAMWSFGTMGIAQCISGASTNLLCNYFSRRFLMLVSAVICALAFILCFWSPNFQFTAYTFGLLFGIGLGITSVIQNVALCQYFKKYLSIANGCSLTGISIGGFTLPLVFNWFISKFGLNSAMLLMGGIILHLLPISILIRPRTGRHFPCLNEALRGRPLFDRGTSTFKPIPTDVPKRSLLKTLSSYAHLFKKPMFYVITIHSVTCMNFMITFGVTLTDFAMDKGLGKSEGVMLLSIMSVGDIVGRAVWGIASDKGCLEKWVIAALTLFISGACAFAVIFAESVSVMGVIVVICGFAMGGSTVMINVLYRKYIGMRLLTSALSLRVAFSGLGSLARPFLVGIFRDVLGSYGNFYILLAAMNIFSGLLWILEPLLRHRRKNRRKTGL